MASTDMAATAAERRTDPPAWSDVRELMRSDFTRMVQRMGMAPTLTRRLLWFALPSYQALFWYRISRHLYLRGWRSTAVLLHLVSQYVTHVDISPSTVIGRGCLLGHPPMVLCGRIGNNFTMNGFGGIGGGFEERDIGGGFEERDIGGGAGLPVVGDNVTMAIRATVLGPVSIGDNAKLGPACTVMRDVPAGAVVGAPLARVLRMETGTEPRGDTL